MLKRITYLEKKHDLDYEGFSDHWRTTHADIARDLPSVACYLQNHVRLTDSVGSASEPFRVDGIVELWFNAPDAVSAASDSIVGDRLVVDEQVFLSGLTGGAVHSGEPHVPWPVKLWVLGHWSDNKGNADDVQDWAESLGHSLKGLLGVNVNELESEENLLIREALRHEARIPQVAVAFGFTSEAEAQAGMVRVRAALEELHQVTNTHLYLGSEVSIVSPDLAS